MAAPWVKGTPHVGEEQLAIGRAPMSLRALAGAGGPSSPVFEPMSPVTVCGYKDQPAEDVDRDVQANNVDYVPGQPIKAL